jgi:hypothetical protein
LEAGSWNRRPLSVKLIHNTARLMDSFL